MGMRKDYYDYKDNNLALLIEDKGKKVTVINTKTEEHLWIYRDVWQIKTGKNLLRKGKHNIKDWTKTNGEIEITYKN